MRKYFTALFLTYLRLSAKLQLVKIKPLHIVGITGSAGKSSCREAVATILATKYIVKQSTTGNSETGLPLDILGFPHDPNYGSAYWLKVLLLTPVKLLTNWQKYDVYVAEMGVDSPHEPKNMSYLLKIIKPDIGVFLNVLPVHTEYFSGNMVQAIANEKSKLITTLPESGFSILNADDQNVIKFKNQTNAKVLTFGSLDSDVKPFSLDIPGLALTEDYAYTFAAAATVGKALGINLSESKNALKENLKLPPGRGSILQGINGSTIIDSSYNSSKIPTIASLNLLNKYPGMRKIAVLGDMRELGDLAKSEHEAVAEAAVKNADYIFTFGPLMDKYFYPKAVSLGFSHKKIKSYESMTQLISEVKTFLKPNDLILVKGSQNTILLETLVDQILANPEDKAKLCRRGEFWHKKRAELLKN